MFLSYLQTDEHFIFLNLKIWILVMFKVALASKMWPSKLSNFKTSSISKQFSVTKIQIFSFREEKCSSVWSYDKNISVFWQKRTFIYSQGLGPSGVSLMNLVLRGEIEEAKQLIADGADVNQRTWFSENLIVIYSSLYLVGPL